MRAVLDATGFCKEMDPLVKYRPTPLLNVADKPILFHIIEALYQKNIKQFDLILSDLPAAIEDKLGEGKRWGIRITYHLARDSHLPFAPLLPSLEDWEETPVLLGRGDSLPFFHREDFKSISPQLFYHHPNLWSGWALLSVGFLKNLRRSHPMEDVPALASFYGISKTFLDSCLSTRSFHDLQTSNFLVLQETLALPFFPTVCRMVSPGIWLSRNVSLHPDALLVPPVFIGENCQIAADTVLGPNAVVENHCIIDKRSKISHSIVFQKSYVGEDLEILNSIVDRNLLINVSHGTSLHIREDFILSELKASSLAEYPLRFLEKILAFLALILLSPFYFYLLITCQLIKKPMLNLPAASDPSLWTTFNWMTFSAKDFRPLNKVQKYFKRLPLLVNVIRGEVHFFGVIPREIKSVKRLPIDWQKLYLKSKVGLITLTDLDHGVLLTEDDFYAAEVFYSTHMSVQYDVKLFFRWLKKKFFYAF